MSISVRPFKRDDAMVWDNIVSKSVNGTFLHSRRFLSYHRDRFVDHSLLIEDKKRRCRGVFPAALDPENPDVIISHPGITYGGIVHEGSLRGSKMIEALQVIMEHYRALGIRTIKYKAVPYIYHREPSQDDLYAFFRLGAHRYRCDISASIDLKDRSMPNRRRRRQLKKAARAGISVESGLEHFESFWPVLEWNRWERHRVRPIHSLDEMKLLSSMFPDNIECHIALLEGEVVAGGILFLMNKVVHVQYAAGNEVGYETAAQDAVLDYCINEAIAKGIHFFNFGTSNTHAGKVLNDGLYKYKLEFGAGGVAHEFYELILV